MSFDGIWAIVQARMGSSRLPGKVMESMAGKPALGHVLDRLEAVSSIWGSIVATTVSEIDDPIELYCHERGVRCFRGDEEDVLDRYRACADSIVAETVIRITSDCPLIDPGIVDFVVDVYRCEEGGVDYVSNGLPPTFPDGLDVEVFSRDALERAWTEAKEPAEREHVTLHFWKNADAYRLLNVKNPDDLSSIRWTLDTPEDLVLIREIYEDLYAGSGGLFGMDEVLEWLEDQFGDEWPLFGVERRQNSLSLRELEKLLRGKDIPSVTYQSVVTRGEER